MGTKINVNRAPFYMLAEQPDRFRSRPGNALSHDFGRFLEKSENVCGKEIADKLTITTVNLFNGVTTSFFGCTYSVLCYPRTLTTFRFPFPLGIPPAAPCPSVAFRPARMVSISTPDGNAGECADTRDLRAG